MKYLSHLFLLAALLIMPTAHARAVHLSGERTSPLIESKTLPSGLEGLPVWFLVRVGVAVQNTPERLTLERGGLTLMYTPAEGWSTPAGLRPELPAPEVYGASVHVGLVVLRALGLPMREGEAVLDLNPLGGPALLRSIRRSVRLEDGAEISRLVLEFSRELELSVDQQPRQVRAQLEGVNVWTSETPLYGELSGQGMVRFGVRPEGQGALLTLETVEGASSEFFVLENPFRLVIDTELRLEPRRYPEGVTLLERGLLRLLTFDPLRFEPQVHSARAGEVLSVADFVGRSGAVAGVNGGYFDPASGLAVDLVAIGGQMRSASLEKRATLGILEGGGLTFGVPRPRYLLRAGGAELRVGTVRARPHPDWITAFVGDGQTPVGAEGFLTLWTREGRVLQVSRSSAVPAAGALTFTFDPRRFPALDLGPGAVLEVELRWNGEGWDGVRDALSAGPLLVWQGRYAVNPLVEGFDARSSLWRPTRQVAFGVLEDGHYAIAYLEWGTPEDFARALEAAGLRTALRLDSGSSAAVFAGDRYLNAGFKRRVPNALLLVPRSSPR